MNKPTIILLSGKSGHGKDFVADIFKEQLTERNKKVLIVHYADLLKFICKTFFNWNGKKDEHGRTLLQHVGTDVIRNNNPDYWVNFIIDIIRMFNDSWDYVLIPDARFCNEINVLKDCKEFNVITVRVTRVNHVSILTQEQQNHISETGLDNYKFDYYISNDTKENIINQIEQIIKEIWRIV